VTVVERDQPDRITLPQEQQRQLAASCRAYHSFGRQARPDAHCIEADVSSSRKARRFVSASYCFT
jgi:hypothetical protein